MWSKTRNCAKPHAMSKYSYPSHMRMFFCNILSEHFCVASANKVSPRSFQTPSLIKLGRSSLLPIFFPSVPHNSKQALWNSLELLTHLPQHSRRTQLHEPQNLHPSIVWSGQPSNKQKLSLCAILPPWTSPKSSMYSFEFKQSTLSMRREALRSRPSYLPKNNALCESWCCLKKFYNYSRSIPAGSPIRIYPTGGNFVYSFSSTLLTQKFNLRC